MNDRIYNRLYNDVLSFLFKDVYLLNQEGEINKPNSFKKKSWKYYVDGGAVKKNCLQYSASYTFDYNSSNNKKKNLSFCSYEDSAGTNLLNFINSVINASPDTFVKFENLVVKDARKYLFEVLNIQIIDSEVDEELLKTLKRYFSSLEKIEFHRCIIKRECNFNNIKVPIKFSECLIENIRSFNDCESNIELLRCSVKKISPSTINSKKIIISCLSNKNYIDIKSLFLKCSFPNLISFRIDPEVECYYNGYSFEDSFTYLPYSAPNIENLIIKGKVTSLDFLTKFKYLIECGILSIYDDTSLMYASVTDSKERKRIFERNKQVYEIAKTLNPNRDNKYIIDELEMQRIIKLSHFKSLIDYTEEDKALFKNTNLISYLLNKEIPSNIEYYYDCYFDELRLRRQKDDIDAMIRHEEKYKIINNMLYAYGLPESCKKIARGKNFIYSANGKPIIFKGIKKSIRTVREAQKKMESIDANPVKLANLNYQTFINGLKNFNLDNSIPIREFIYAIEDRFDFKISGKDFLEFGEYGKKIAGLFEMNDRAQERLDKLQIKQSKYKDLLIQLIINNYDLFTPSEKAYLYMHWFDYHINKPIIPNNNFFNNYSTIVNNENKILASINNKTANLYSTYYNYIKIIFKQYHMLDESHDIEINPNHIKQLKLK